MKPNSDGLERDTEEGGDVRMASWRLGRWLWILSVLLAAWLGGVGCTRTVHVERSVSGAVSDQEAVEISVRALTAARFDRELYEPERWNRTNFFARNVYNTNSGYVVWRRKAKGGRGLAVEMQIEGSTAVCEVVRTCH